MRRMPSPLVVVLAIATVVVCGFWIASVALWGGSQIRTTPAPVETHDEPAE